MTRFRISVCILAVLIGISVFPAVWLNGKCGNLISLAEETISCCDHGDDSKAKKTALELEHEIHQFRRAANVLVKHDRLAEISRLAARIAPLIDNGSDEATAELKELSELLESLRDGEKPFPNNIF